MDNVRFLICEGYPVGEDIRNILTCMSEAEGVVKPVVALPDIHFKSSYHTPTGVVVLTKDTIVPKFLNANCGMSFVKTPFLSADIDDKKLDLIFGYLRDNISVSTRLAPVISHKDLREIIRQGAAWAVNRYGMDPADLINFENNGSLLKDDKRDIDEIMSFIPQICREVGLLSLGVLGYGNHFIELQEVEEIINKDIAEKFGISKGQLCFMLHSDSRAFGQSIFDFYSGKAKKLLGLQQAYKKIHYGILSRRNAPMAIKKSLNALNYYLNRAKPAAYWKMGRFRRKTALKFEVIEAASSEGQAYLVSTYCALNYGYANRAYLASVIRDALGKAFEKDTRGMHILCDGNHDALQKENIDGEDFYVHRNGANRALPPEYFTTHPVFSRTGQPVILPSSLGRPSFLCAATRGCRDSYYSSCHGAGRLIDRAQAGRFFKAPDVLNEIRGRRMKVYDYGRGCISEEAPAAFKDAQKILEAVVKYDIAQPVARLRPLAALKGWR